MIELSTGDIETSARFSSLGSAGSNEDIADHESPPLSLLYNSALP